MSLWEEQALPPRVEWPKGPKARRVAEAVYADMRKPLGLVKTPTVKTIPKSPSTRHKRLEKLLDL